MVGLWFAFKILLFALCAGAIIAVIIFVPLSIYIIPYSLWLGNQHTMGRYVEKKNDKFFKIVKSATKVYGSWIRGKKPSF
ncbi:hypothetical protein V3851_23705 [Paenibacillus sp. M1]|uniref:Uncharacterized protein n=1 Tax=Paenibacillus haidiansis TaxID=1574488 RepID=A0ABU7VX63_9BACL